MEQNATTTLKAPNENEETVAECGAKNEGVFSEGQTNINSGTAETQKRTEIRRKRRKVRTSSVADELISINWNLVLNTIINSRFDKFANVTIRPQSTMEEQRAFSRAIAKRRITDASDSKDSEEEEGVESVHLEINCDAADKSETADNPESNESADAGAGTKPEAITLKKAFEKPNENEVEYICVDLLCYFLYTITSILMNQVLQALLLSR